MSDSSSRSLLTLFRPSTAQPSAAAGGKPEIVLIQHTLKLFDKRIAAAREPYISSVLRPIVGHAPNVALPLRYHEKLLWRKIFDRNPLFVGSS